MKISLFKIVFPTIMFPTKKATTRVASLFNSIKSILAIHITFGGFTGAH